MAVHLTSTWVRLGDRWVRADRIVAVELERSPGAALGGRWRVSTDRSQRLMVCTTLPAEEENGGKAVWQEAAVCAPERGEIVAGTLLDAMGSTTAAAGTPRYVYPVRSHEGRVTHWTASTTLPQGPALTGPVHALAGA
ncbi:hypothetical protein ACFU6M_26225 [Streptomyces bottropensis]|uniref:hypothetical protein n=1 Tax=Streptomyces bottropensis TaxID=42235 RepID=UPI00367FA27D